MPSSTTTPGGAADVEHVLEHDVFLRGLARHLARDEHAAEDLVQQTWLAAWERRDVRPFSLRAWMGCVLRRLAGKERRARRRRQHRQEAASRPERVPSTAEIVEREAVRREIVDAVLHLHEPYRSTVLLRYFDDLAPRQIAQRLDVPVETVRTRLKRAIALLQARLDHLHEGDRKAWLLPLVPLLDGRSTTWIPSGEVLRNTFPGVLLMSTKTKLVGTAAVLGGLLLTALWVVAGLPDGDPPQRGASIHGAPVVAPVGGEEKDLRSTAEDGQPVRRQAVSTATATTAKTGSLLVEAVWKEDGTPATGVLLRVQPFGSADLLFDVWEGITGGDGTLLLEDLPAQRLWVRAQRGATGDSHARAEVEAGRRTEVTLELDPGLDVRGVVVDPGGEPVPDADVVVAPWVGGRARALAKTDTAGGFHLRDIGTHSHVGARAPGFAPSPLHRLIGSAGGSMEVRIVMPGPGGTVAGVVLGPEGQPVEGAVVQAQEGGSGGSFRLEDGTRAKAPMPLRGVTDAEGHFRLQGLETGGVSLEVRARGLSTWRGEVEVHAHRQSEVAVALLPGATLSGVVRDATGAPIENARVRTGLSYELGARQVRTGPGGGYSIDGLGPGELKVRVEAEAVGEVEATLEALPGQRLRWDPVLSRGVVLRGRVLDQDGEPVARAMINATQRLDGGTSWLGHENTDTQGRFAIKGCEPELPVRLRIRRKGAFDELDVEHVPGPEEVVLRLPSWRPVRIRGVVLDANGEPADNVSVTPFRRGASSSPVETTEAGTGAFDLGPYPPGEYQVAFDMPGYASVRTDWRLLGPDETWDLGATRLERPGFLTVVLQAAEGLPTGKLRFTLLDKAGRRAGSVEIENGLGRSGPLAPGTHQLQVWGHGLASALHDFEVRPGQECRLDVPVRRGVSVGLVAETEGSDAPRFASLEIVDSNGRPVFRGAMGRDEEGLRQVCALQPGAYRAIASAGERLRGQVGFEVEEGATERDVRFVLR